MATQANFDIACNLYKEFLSKYSRSHNYKGKNYTHSISSSFVYKLVKNNCIWLLSLIMGVAGYSVYFDDDTEASKIITKEMLDQTGVTDPVLTYKSTITPWSGLTSVGKTPYAPVDKVVTGVGIAHFNRGGLESFYKASALQASLPKIDENGVIIYDNGIMQTELYTIAYNNSPIYGWGMSYGSKKLSLSTITNNTSNLSYVNSNEGKVSLKGKLYDSTIKLIGPEYGKVVGTTSYMSKDEASSFIEWCSVHFSDSRDCLFPPLLWMAKYWAPFFSWHDNERTNSIHVCMLASSVLNSGGLSASSMQGKSEDDIIQRFLDLGKTQKDKEHFQRRIVNTQRAIALLDFIKRV